MKRRLAVVSVLTVALSGGVTAAQAISHLGGATALQTRYWACAGVRDIDLGVCVENPLPERLPIPEGDPTAGVVPPGVVPAVPTVPAAEVPAVPVAVPPVEIPAVPTVEVPAVQVPPVPTV